MKYTSWSALLALSLACSPSGDVTPDGSRADGSSPDGSVADARPDGAPGDSGPAADARIDAAPPGPVDGFVWQPQELSFTGPTASELDIAPNPFLDFRMTVTFVGPSAQRYAAPGFFAADGVGGDSGDVWRVRFTPDEAGAWSYSVAFEQGASLAIADPATSGTALAAPDGPHGQAGTFNIGPVPADAQGFFARGRLEAVGAHYLRFRDGSYWLKGGTDSPENFLAYAGFDNTTHSRLHLHDYDGHVGHFRDGDPDWGDGRSRGIVGALNYLASVHVNSVYMLLMNIGGDGQDVWPFAGSIDPGGSVGNDNGHFDVGKLRQWNVVFEHAQRLGIVLHLVLGEAEAANKVELDGGELGLERKLYYREMAARFGHHNALQWNISEEYDLAFDLGAARVRDFAAYLGSVDVYDHPITAHNSRGLDAGFAALLGDGNLTLTSFQTHWTALDGMAEEWRARSDAAGVPWAISFDEFTVDVGQATPWTPVYVPDDYRKLKTWAIFLSGAQLEYILPDYLGTDLFTGYEQLWNETWYARRFLEENTRFWDMVPSDHLLEGEAGYSNGHAQGSMGGQVFAIVGESYAIYLPNASSTGTLDLSGVSGTFEGRWYNPRTGAFEGSPTTLAGGGPAALGPAPTSEDWALLVERI